MRLLFQILSLTNSSQPWHVRQAESWLSSNEETRAQRSSLITFIQLLNSRDET